ncbi:MAG: hypothetical protein QMD11_05525 [Smithella sp.]|nr:hypothetical protein [Smithella sp.]
MDAILHTAWFPVAKLIAVPVGLYLLWKAKERVPRVKYYASVPFLAYSALMAYHLYLFFTGYGA